MKYYLAGPFWDKECKEFFDKFIERCTETRMSNKSTFVKDIEELTSSVDEVFVPGHFPVDFNKIKSEYDPSSFRRVLKQILDLDLNNLDDGLVVYSKGYDLGTMFELGYFLGIYQGVSKYQTYNELRKRLIIHDGDEELYRCMKMIIDSYDFISRNYKEDSGKILLIDNDTFPYVLNNYDRSCKVLHEFNIAAINVDIYKDTPIGSIMAGYLYRLGIPFVTYSREGNDSNIMMLASSIGHVNIAEDDEFTRLPISEYLENLIEEMWNSKYFEKFNNIK